MLLPLLVLVRTEGTTEDGVDAQQGEEVYRDPRPGQALRLGWAGEVEVARDAARHSLEDRALTAVVHKLPGRTGEPVLIARTAPNPHDPAGVAERQGAQEDRIDNAPDR